MFDIETVPDVDLGRSLHPNLEALDDEAVLSAMTLMRQSEAGNDFMVLPLHKIACLSFLWVDAQAGEYRLKSLSLQTMDEQTLIATFLRAFEKSPTLVSWNGIGFDVPVLMYRALHYGMSAPRLFFEGKNSYTSRYGDKHIDVMDKLSLHNYAYRQKLDTIAKLCGTAGKGGTDGTQVVPMVKAGDWDKLCLYCESDVLNTWLVYLRYQLLLGKLPQASYQTLCQNTQAMLEQQKDTQGKPRHAQFCEPSHLNPDIMGVE